MNASALDGLPKINPVLRSAKMWLAMLLVSGAALAAFYPGYMTIDGVEQLTQARAGTYDDWHPPIMAFVWRYLDMLWPGPQGLILLHAAMTAAGFYLAFNRRLLPTLAAAFFPGVFALLGSAWKDVGMTAGLTLAVGLWLAGYKKSALLPALYAACIRYNAIIALLPLLWIVARGRWLRFAVTLVAFVLAARLVTATLINGKTRMHGKGSLIALWLNDLVGISVQTRAMLIPDRWLADLGQPPPDLDELGRLRGLCDAGAPIWTPKNSRHFTLGGTDSTAFLDLARGWFHSLRVASAAYLQHRWNIFSAWMRGGEPGVTVVSLRDVHPNQLGVMRADTWLNRLVVAALDRLEGTFVFRGWFYLLAGALGLLLMRGVWWWVVLSGVLYVLAGFVISPGCDFRYLNWLVHALLIGALASLLPPRLEASPPVLPR